MRKFLYSFVAVLSLVATGSLSGQAPPPILGTWKAELGDQNRKDGPREVVVRPDSSASWSKETVRWRLKADSILIALGGEWVTYRLQVKGTRMTLSGGDLAKPISLSRVGPPSQRPDSIPIPPDPDATP
jgi:hypothetical protein